MAQPTRVLIVDDSALMRHRLGVIINNADGFEVAGSASNGKECLSQLARLQPDVVTLDVEMPEMDGLTTLGQIMHVRPTPVVMISSLTERGTHTSLEALALGAVDCLAKPEALSTDAAHPFSRELISKLAIASNVRTSHLSPHVVTEPMAVAPRRESTSKHDPKSLVIIGSSTGGPQALDCLFSHLPNELPAALMIVQHMPPLFTRSLATRLARRTSMEVREVEEGDKLEVGLALVAQGGSHMTLGQDGRLHLDQREPLHGVRPAVDYTLYSLAESWRGRLLVVILTGMGVDGADGARMLHGKGAQVFAQDEATSIVFGMPRAVVEADAASMVLPIEQMGAAIGRWAATAIAPGLSVV